MKAFVPDYLLLALVAVSMLSPPSALAGGCDAGAHKHTPEEMANSYFDKMDLNGDKIVTKEEFRKSSLSKMVKSFDALNPDDKGLVKRNDFIQSFIRAHSEPKPKV